MKPGRWTTPGKTGAGRGTVGDLGEAAAKAGPGTTVGDLGEAAVIERIRRRTPAPPDWVGVGIGDDAAVVEPARGALDVVTTDSLVEGVHFDLSFMSAADVGHRALAVNLSDLAAMGAAPRTAVLALVLPGTMAAADLDAAVDGLLALAARHRTALVGGNVTRTDGPLVLGLTAVGAVRRRRVLTRGGGRPGDELWVTGHVGAAAAGLAALRRGTPADADSDGDGRAVGLGGGELRQGAPAGTDSDDGAAPGEGGAAPLRRGTPADADSDPDLDDCIQRYRRPEPRVHIGALLGRNRVARACIDLSDGLADGVRQLAGASGTGAVVDAAAVPVHAGARRWFVRNGQDPVEAALAGGDDYELLVAVPRRRLRALRALSRLFQGVPITRIGELTKAPGLVLRTPGGNREIPPGYEHFRPAPGGGGAPAARG